MSESNMLCDKLPRVSLLGCNTLAILVSIPLEHICGCSKMGLELSIQPNKYSHMQDSECA